MKFYFHHERAQQDPLMHVYVIVGYFWKWWLRITLFTSGSWPASDYRTSCKWVETGPRLYFRAGWR